MARYIDADDIKNAIEGVTRNYLSTLSTTDTIDSVTAKWLYKRLKTLVDEMPTADVVERKRGKWTEPKVIVNRKAIEEWQSARCSVCGRYHTTPYLYYFSNFAYCPWCGAEMEDGR